jgi:hypothetical protein
MQNINIANIQILPSTLRPFGRERSSPSRLHNSTQEIRIASTDFASTEFDGEEGKKGKTKEREIKRDKERE